jgi:hypothetical protein
MQSVGNGDPGLNILSPEFARTISHEVAKELSLQHYEKYRKNQDAEFVSDFDRQVKLLLESKDAQYYL